MSVRLKGIILLLEIIVFGYFFSDFIIDLMLANPQQPEVSFPLLVFSISIAFAIFFVGIPALIFFISSLFTKRFDVSKFVTSSLVLATVFAGLTMIGCSALDKEALKKQVEKQAMERMENNR